MNEFAGYGEEHEEVVRLLCRSLPEDHRRRYAAVEVLKIGYGGISYAARVLGLNRGTSYSGVQELAKMQAAPDNPQRPSGEGRIRRPGAGRPPVTAQPAGLQQTGEGILAAQSAGRATKAAVTWTEFKPWHLAQAVIQRGYTLCRNTAAALLAAAGFKKRTLRKELITGEVDPAERNGQFEHSAALRAAFHEQGLPVFCVDTKKKALLGLQFILPGEVSIPIHS